MNPHEKAGILIEALPYIRKFYGQCIVIKYGGAALAKADLKESFARDVTLLKYIGINPVVVHGGGPQIGEVLGRMGISSTFCEGLRITNDETMDVAEMVLVGSINQQIVSMINHCGGRAVGLSGKDGKLIQAKKAKPYRPKKGSRKTIDLGRVGEIIKVNPGVIDTLDKDKYIPVIAPIGVGPDGEAYNINADIAAGYIAKALNAAKLILLTDTEGVKDTEGKLISTITPKEAKEYIKKGVITGGMMPKVTCCLEALGDGVGQAHIIDGRVKHAVLLEIFTDTGVGTEIMKG
jgi:acetylglutamate kinase